MHNNSNKFIRPDVDYLNVDLGQRSYDIMIGNNMLNDTYLFIKDILPVDSIIIVTDENVAKLHLDTLEKSLNDNGVNCESFILPAGEKTKSFSVLNELIENIMSTRPERKTTIIALGGGVIGDITGFAASIILRGINFIQIPTTLLAQVDSSVGGKTAINSKYGKNLIGSFYQPKAVIADMNLLSTLSDREYKAGYAEIVKYGIINNFEFFKWLDSNIDNINERDIATLSEAVRISCESKAYIVSQDEKEKGMRALLNLGHTFGHALEAECSYDGTLVHGEAVAIGMVMAMKFSYKHNLCSKNDAIQVERHLKDVGLPTSIYDIRDNWDAQILLEHMYQDKKVDSGQLVLILAKSIGEAFISKNIDGGSVLEFLQEMIDGKYNNL